MASGSTAPFSGEFVDLENVPKLPEGISAEQIFEQNSDVVRQVAEARHAAGLSQVEADGGFFDAFVDSSKINSLSSVDLKSGSNGFLSLLNVINSEDFNDGFSGFLSLDDEWNVTNNRIQAFSNGDGGAYVKKIYSSTVSPTTIKFDFFMGADGNTESGDGVFFRLQKNQSTSGIRFSNDPLLIIMKVFTNGDIKFGGQKQGNLTKGKEVTFKLELDYANENIDVFKDGSLVGSTGFFTSASGIQSISWQLDTFNVSNTQEFRIDNVKLESLNSSGTVTEQQFTFTDTQGNSFSPSKVGLFPEQTLNGQSITYDLKDSTGTVVKTFNQSDLNQLQSVNTTDTTFQVEANFSGNGSQTPELEFLDVRGV